MLFRSIRQDVGALWENYIIGERRKANFNEGLHREFYFWRTYDKPVSYTHLPLMVWGEAIKTDRRHCRLQKDRWWKMCIRDSLKNNDFCLLMRQSFVIVVKMKTADCTFGYGHSRGMEDSYSAWKQAEIDIRIVDNFKKVGVHYIVRIHD